MKADEPSFNLWHDDELIDFLREKNYDDYQEYLSSEGEGGNVSVSVSALKRALKKFNWEKEDYRKESIKADIEWAEKKSYPPCLLVNI